MEKVKENEEKWQRGKEKWGKMVKNVFKKWEKNEENEKCKGGGKDRKKLEDFFFCFSLLGIHWNFFGVYQIWKFEREKAKITPGKNREKWPPWKIFLLRPCFFHIASVHVIDLMMCKMVGLYLLYEADFCASPKVAPWQCAGMQVVNRKHFKHLPPAKVNIKHGTC